MGLTLCTAWHRHCDVTAAPLQEFTSVSHRVAQAAALKEEGNSLFKVGKFSEACACYEKALGLFKFVRHSDPNWRKSRKGLCDEDLTIVSETGSTQAERDEVARLRLALYQNLASTNLKVCLALGVRYLRCCVIQQGARV